MKQKKNTLKEITELENCEMKNLLELSKKCLNEWETPWETHEVKAEMTRLKNLAFIFF